MNDQSVKRPVGVAMVAIVAELMHPVPLPFVGVLAQVPIFYSLHRPCGKSKTCQDVFASGNGLYCGSSQESNDLRLDCGPITCLPNLGESCIDLPSWTGTLIPN